LINEYNLEHWDRCRAVPSQPEVEKEIQPEVEASSCKLQAPSFKRLEKDIIKK